MSNLAEKLPKLFRDRVEDLETRGRKIADRFDALIDQYVPESVITPLRTDEGLSIQSIRSAVTAAGEELVTRIRGGKTEEAETPETVETAPEPAAKKPAAKKPAAKKPAAKKPAAKKPAAKKPAPRPAAPLPRTPTSSSSSAGARSSGSKTKLSAARRAAEEAEKRSRNAVKAARKRIEELAGLARELAEKRLNPRTRKRIEDRVRNLADQALNALKKVRS
jgi:chemotaxis protein histidine kinase CheA